MNISGGYLLIINTLATTRSKVRELIEFSFRTHRIMNSNIYHVLINYKFLNFVEFSCPVFSLR